MSLSVVVYFVHYGLLLFFLGQCTPSTSSTVVSSYSRYYEYYYCSSSYYGT